MLGPHLFRSRFGFTLVEILVVIAVIGALASVILPALSSGRDKARISKAEASVKEIINAVQFLKNDTNEWPNHVVIGGVEAGAGGNEIWDLSGIAIGIMGTDTSYPQWSGPYLSNLDDDPWGNPYFIDPDYDVDPSAGEDWQSVVGSFGPNGVGQNVFDNDDIFMIIRPD